MERNGDPAGYKLLIFCAEYNLSCLLWKVSPGKGESIFMEELKND